MNRSTHFINSQLEQRKQQHLLRSLPAESNLIDFCSNDYLGFARSLELKQLVIEALSQSHELLGSTGSRLITGNSIYTELLETELASFHDAESGLLYNSGYDANLGLFSSLLQRGDTVITDELAHASILDGTRLSYANRFTFKHNDLQSLEDKLRVAKGTVYIAIESIYSMDGDKAPLSEIIELAEKFDAAVIVDEAHATGIFGRDGRGLVNQHELQSRVFARVITFGKALGTHGAIVLGSKELRSYLINFSRPFIYSTAASFYSNLSIGMAYRFLSSQNHQQKIMQVIAEFKLLTEPVLHHFIPSDSAIQSMLIAGNVEAKNAAGILQKAGFDVRAILYPSVPAGKERLRICLHTFNTSEQLAGLAAILKQLV